MKCIRNIVLQSLSVLVIGSSLCASPVELSSIEAQKAKLLKEMIAAIDCNGGPGGDIPVFREGNQAICMRNKQSLQIFKQCYDDYRVCFPQGDAEVDKALKARLERRVKEKQVAIGALEDELEQKTKQKNKGILRNLRADYAAFGTAAALTAYALYQFGNGDLEIIGSGLALGFAGGSCMICLTELHEVARAVNYLAIKLKAGKKQLVQLNQAYTYAFPNESTKCEVL